MNIQELIDKLSEVPKEKRNLPIYIFDYELNDHVEINAVSLYDGDKKHSKENMLSISINSTFH